MALLDPDVGWPSRGVIRESEPLEAGHPFTALGGVSVSPLDVG